MTVSQARHWFLNNHFDGELSLSERITALRVQDQVIETIRVNLANANRLTQMTEELANFTTEEDIAPRVRVLEQLARRVIGGDVAAYNDYQRSIKAVKNSLGDESKLDRAYAGVVRASEALNEAGLDMAIENAIDKKAMSNAFRIATTEFNRAYNMGVYTRAKADEDCLAMQLDLSSAGDNCDECVDLATADNGAGPGIYPMDETPETPVHPHCLCLLTPVYRLPNDMDPDELETDGDFDTMEEIPD
jgi:hypothetical protein